MVVSLYLHALSHGQMYVTFSSRVKHGLDDLFYFIDLTRVLNFAMVVFLYLHGQLYLAFSSRVKVGLDNPENLGHLGHF